MKFMNQLAKIRKHKRISYFDIEAHTGIPCERMKQLESGNANITVGELEKLLGFYRLTFEQVLKYHRRHRLQKALFGVLVLAVLFIGAFYLKPDALSLTSFTNFGGTIEETNGPAPAADDAASAGGADDAAGAGESDEAAGTGEDLNPASAETVTEALPDAADNGLGEKMVFRFWGNIPYHAERLPQTPEQSHARVMDIFPIQYLNDARPDWLLEKEKDQFLINAATTEVWTPSTIEAYQALKEDQYHVLGLGTLPEVYEPHIVETPSMKIGFLTLTGLIRNAEEIALPSRIGLPRAYRNDEVTEAVKNAKEKVDFLFVLIDWGKRYGKTPNTAQKLIADAIIKAGGDMVIGNRPLYAQEIITIDGKPVFYALGHSVSDNAADESYNMIVEAEFSEQLDKITIRVGKLKNGMIRFELSPEDRDNIQALFGGMTQLTDHFEIVW